MNLYLFFLRSSDLFQARASDINRLLSKTRHLMNYQFR